MIYVLYGVPGSGKSHLYEQEYSYAVHCDVADVYAASPGVHWSLAATTVCREAIRHDSAVIEGLFLPGTPSRQLLDRVLLNYDVEYIHVHAPLEVCRQRILDRKQDNEEICLKILSAYWNRAEELWKASR